MNTPNTNASPTPNGKATAIPAMDTEAERRILEALKITPDNEKLLELKDIFQSMLEDGD